MGESASDISDPLSTKNVDVQIRVRNADGTTRIRWVPFQWLLDLIDDELAQAVTQAFSGENLDEPE